MINKSGALRHNKTFFTGLVILLALVGVLFSTALGQYIVPSANSQVIDSVINLTCNFTGGEFGVGSPGANVTNVSFFYQNQTNEDNLTFLGTTYNTTSALVFNFSWDTSGLSDGRYNFTCVGTNITLQENISGLANATRTNIVVDNDAPTVSMNTPTNYLNSSNTSMELNFTVDDAGNGTYLCNLTIDDTLNTSNINVSIATTNFTLFTFADQAHSWYVNCWDTLGHNYTNTTNNFTVDSSQPVASFANSTPSANTNHSSNFEVNLSIADGTTGVYHVNLTLLQGATVVWENKSILLGGNQIDGIWNVTIPVADMPDGFYNMTVNTSDYVGNQNWTLARQIGIDDTAPTVAKNTPANMTNSTSLSDVFNFTVSDPVAGVAYCNITVDGPNYNTSYQLGTITGEDVFTNVTFSGDGHHNWSVICWDTLGQIGDNGTYNITVDRVAPEVTFGLGGINASGNYSADLQVNVTVTDATTSVWVVNVTLYNGTTNGTALNEVSLNLTLNTGTRFDGEWNATLDVDAVTEGKWNVTINASDYAGNLNFTVKREILIDRTAPTISLVNQSNETINLGSDRNLSINITISDAWSGVEGQTCFIYLNDSNVGNLTATNGQCFGNVTIQKTLMAGNYTLNTSVTDHAGNQVYTTTQWSTNITVESDDQAPAFIQLLSPGNNSYNNTHNITVNASDAYGFDVALDLIIVINNSNITGYADAIGLAGYTANLSNLTLASFHGPNGTHYNFTINATDDAGNSVLNGSYIFKYDPVGPAVRIDFPASNANYSSSYVTFNLTVNDVNLNTTIINTSNMSIWTGRQDAAHYANFTPALVLAEGNYTVNIWSDDTLGNYNDTQNISFSIDRTPPNITLNSPANPDIVNNTANMTINLTVVDPFGMLRYVNVSLWNASGNQTAPKSLVLLANRYYNNTFDLAVLGAGSTLADGVYNITLWVEDYAGNTNITNITSIEIDSTAPTLTSWWYSKMDNNLTLNFSDVMDVRSATARGNVTGIEFNHSDGSSLLTTLTGATIHTSHNSSQVNITPTRAQYLTLNQYLDEDTLLSIAGNAWNDTAGNLMTADQSSVTIFSITRWSVRIPSSSEDYLGESSSWETFTLTTNMLDDSSVNGTNYNVNTILTSVNGSYKIIYGYNSTSGTWKSFAPAAAANTFPGFSTDFNTVQFNIYMNKTNAIEIR